MKTKRGDVYIRYVVVKDKYTKARGGSAKFNIVACVKCRKNIFIYQKNGPGRLLRMYLDKFVAPEQVVKDLKVIN